MHKIKSIVTTISLATTTFADIAAQVPCFDTNNLSKYHNVCIAIGSLSVSDSWSSGPNSIYTCKGDDPGYFYSNLKTAGIATCVCGYFSADGTKYTYSGEYGTCNGACQSSTFTCQGTTPIGSNYVAANPSSSSIVTQSVASSNSGASSILVSSPTSSSSSKSGAGHAEASAKISSIIIAFVLATLGMN